VITWNLKLTVSFDVGVDIVRSKHVHKMGRLQVWCMACLRIYIEEVNTNTGTIAYV